jgi:hypothetical protein
MMPAPAAMAANCTSVLRSSSALLGPVSRSSGITATVPTYKKVPAVKGRSMSPLLEAASGKHGDNRAGTRLYGGYVPGQTRPAETSRRGNTRAGAGTTSKLLDGNADQRAQQRTQRRHKLRAHGGTLGEARLNEQGEVAHLVGDLMEEDGDGRRGPNGRRRVEGRGHGKPVGDVVREIGAARGVSVDASAEGRDWRTLGSDSLPASRSG